MIEKQQEVASFSRIREKVGKQKKKKQEGGKGDFDPQKKKKTKRYDHHRLWYIKGDPCPVATFRIKTKSRIINNSRAGFLLFRDTREGKITALCGGPLSFS